jgi:hypothetical protein
MAKEFLVPINRQLMALLPSVGAPMADPNVELPIFEDGINGCSIVVKVTGLYDKDELNVERRYQLGSLDEGEADFISTRVAETVQDPTFRNHPLKAISRLNAGEGLEDRRLQRVLSGVTQFCGPRMSELIFLIYKAAYEQGTKSPLLDTRSLLEAQGYRIRGQLRDFDPHIRNQLAQDILALHRTDITFVALAPARSGKKGQKDVSMLLRNILRIDRAIYRDRPEEEIDFESIGDLTFQLPDQYYVGLGFYDEKDSILLSLPKRGTPRKGITESRQYVCRCLNYLVGRLAWDRQQVLNIRKSVLLQKTGIMGANTTRNNQLLDQTLDELVQQGYLKNAEIVRSKGSNQDMVRIEPNPEQVIHLSPKQLEFEI